MFESFLEGNHKTFTFIPIYQIHHKRVGRVEHALSSLLWQCVIEIIQAINYSKLNS